jgi:3,4-dihydroxy-2-butanone 4-phosphate synthase
VGRPAVLLIGWCDLLVRRSREGETDMYFSGLLTQAPQLRMLRTQAGGELYIAVSHEVRSTAACCVNAMMTWDFCRHTRHA